MNHTNNVSAIEKRAYGFAASYFLTFTGEWDAESKFYEGYVKLQEHYDQHGELDNEVADVWSKFEHDDPEEVFVQIDDMALAIIRQVEQALQDVKAGLVDGAIEATLPYDYNQLDMKALAQPVAEST